MTVASVLAAGRAAALARMTDTVKVTRGAGEFDEESGTMSAETLTIYQGPGRLKLGLFAQITRQVEAQSQLLTTQDPRLDLPIDAPEGAVGDPANVRTGDLVEVLASETESDLAGQTAQVTGIFPHSQATARRYPVKVVTESG